MVVPLRCDDDTTQVTLIDVDRYDVDLASLVKKIKLFGLPTRARGDRPRLLWGREDPPVGSEAVASPSGIAYDLSAETVSTNAFVARGNTNDRNGSLFGEMGKSSSALPCSCSWGEDALGQG